MEEQENKNEQEETQKEPENSSTLEDPAEAQPEKQAEQPEEKTEDIQAGNVQPDNLQQEEQPNPQPEKQAENEPHILEVPLFSEETADFLMRSQNPEDAKAFLEGHEYSLSYLSKKFIFSAWDNYCDNFYRLILPVIFFAAADSFPLVLLIFSSNLIFPALFSIFFLAPLQISKNLFYIHLISGVKKPFHNSLKVFSSNGIKSLSIS